MEPQIKLAQLRALMERAPEFSQYKATSREHLVWLSQGHAIISKINDFEAMSFKIASDNLSFQVTRESNLAKIFGILHRAIAALELDLPSDIQVGFGAGDIYDFFKALNHVISSAEKSLFIIDPYLDESVFDHYLNSRANSVSVRLLLNKGAEKLTTHAIKYNSQFGNVLEISKSSEIHDRIIFVDDFVCWTIGQSLKDAAKAKPTYLVQLPPDVVSAKLKMYESIWSSAQKF